MRSEEVSGELAACLAEEESLVVIADTGCGQIQINKLLEEEPRADELAGGDPAKLLRVSGATRGYRDWRSSPALRACRATTSP